MVLKIQSNLIGAAEMAMAVKKDTNALYDMLCSAEEVLVASHMILSPVTPPNDDYVDNKGDDGRIERARDCLKRAAENFGKITDEQLGVFGHDGWENILLATDEVLRNVHVFV